MQLNAKVLHYKVRVRGADLTCGHPAQLYSESTPSHRPALPSRARGRAGGAGGWRGGRRARERGGQAAEAVECVPRGGREGEGRRCGQQRGIRGVLRSWLRATHLLSKVWQGMEAAACGQALARGTHGGQGEGVEEESEGEAEGSRAAILELSPRLNHHHLYEMLDLFFGRHRLVAGAGAGREIRTVYYRANGTQSAS